MNFIDVGSDRRMEAREIEMESEEREIKEKKMNRT